MSSTSATSAYLSTLESKLRERKHTLGEFRPFEEAIPEVGISFLQSGGLETQALHDLHDWLIEHPTAEVALYGSVNLAVTNKGELPWDSSFRRLVSRPSSVYAIPFVDIHVSRRTSSRFFDVSLYARTAVWLKNGGDLNGRIGEREADENLANLTSLAACLVGSNMELVQTDLTLDGSVFRKEVERIQAAFSGLGPLHVYLD